MSRDLRGRVIAITGGARGIGYATAQLLTARGAMVAIGDIDEPALKQAADTLGLACYARLDVTDPESFAGFLDRVEAELGPLDVLVNNAGIMPTGRIVDEPDAVTRRIIDINVLGVITGSKLAARRMIRRGRGHVINIASMAGETYVPGVASYCASKYAVVGFTDAVRLENRTTGVRFSSVLPSFVNTDLTSGTQGVRGFRNAEPSDIAAAIARLIVRPRPKVRVTRALGALVVSQRFIPRPLAEAVHRTLGGDRTFLDDVDADARQAYEDRARAS